jgi:phage major head subunit gpT-like protein
MVYVMLGKQLKELPDIWRQYTNVIQSDRQTEISMNVVGFGDVPTKPEGTPYPTDVLMPGNQKTVTHTEFGMAFEVTQTALEDDRFAQLKKYAMWLAFSAGYVCEKRAANLLNNGFTTEVTADGLSIFNTGHVLVRGGTFRNRPSSDVALSWTSLKNAIVDLSTETKHDSGQIALAAQKLILVVPPALEMLADRIVNSNGLPQSTDNDRNSIKSRRDISIVANPLLTSTTAWYLLSANKEMHGIKAYERVPISQEPPTTDPRTRSRLYPIRFRYSWFADVPQNSWGTAGA